MTYITDTEARGTCTSRDDSNLALDWLWVAANARTPQERRYCLERARVIDPTSLRLLREGAPRHGRALRSRAA
jgi:hypothetical protein